MVRVGVLFGDGLNCEQETAFAFEKVGAKVDIVHIFELLRKPDKFLDYSIWAWPGGFSFGDELGGGKILSLKMKRYLMPQIQHFISEGWGIIGICNGFQVLLELKLINLKIKDRLTAPILIENSSGKFIDKWCDLKIPDGCKSFWIKGFLGDIYLPIRHGEGRAVFYEDCFSENDIFNFWLKNGQVALVYDTDENGSTGNIAGICNSEGNILGLMPHPEAAICEGLVPEKWDVLRPGPGLMIFKNGVDYYSK